MVARPWPELGRSSAAAASAATNIAIGPKVLEARTPLVIESLRSCCCSGPPCASEPTPPGAQPTRWRENHMPGGEILPRPGRGLIAPDRSELGWTEESDERAAVDGGETALLEIHSCPGLGLDRPGEIRLVSHQENRAASRRQLTGVEVAAPQRLGFLRLDPQRLAGDPRRVPRPNLRARQAGLELGPQHRQGSARGLRLTSSLVRQLARSVVRGIAGGVAVTEEPDHVWILSHLAEKRGAASAPV